MIVLLRLISTWNPVAAIANYTTRVVDTTLPFKQQYEALQFLGKRSSAPVDVRIDRSRRPLLR
jgi:hypothetical protein